MSASLDVGDREPDAVSVAKSSSAEEHWCNGDESTDGVVFLIAASCDGPGGSDSFFACFASCSSTVNMAKEGEEQNFPYASLGHTHVLFPFCQGPHNGWIPLHFTPREWQVVHEAVLHSLVVGLGC